MGAEGLYRVSIGAICLRLLELQKSDDEAWKIRAERLKSDYEEVDEVLHHHKLPFVLEAIRTELISWHYNNPLVGHFGIDKTRELVGRKSYWLSLRRDVESHVRGCDVCLASMVVKHKPYGDLQFLPILTHWWKDLSMDFMTGLPLFSDWKSDSYDSILVIIDRLTKMVYYEPVKVTINTSGLAKVIIDVVVRHPGLPDSIISDRGAIFTSKLWSSLCWFLEVKQKLSTAFYPQIDGQTKRHNSTMEAYLRAFVNFEQNDWARLLPMVEIAYNNAKNASTSHTPFELNCGYHRCVSYKENVDPCSKSKSVDDLANDLWELMIVYRENL